MCAGAWIDGRPPFRSDVGLFDTGTDYAVLPGKNLRNENADTCQAIAFLCLHIFILLCANIIPKATNPVKGITR